MVSTPSLSMTSWLVWSLLSAVMEGVHGVVHQPSFRDLRSTEEMGPSFGRMSAPSQQPELLLSWAEILGVLAGIIFLIPASFKGFLRSQSGFPQTWLSVVSQGA